MSDPTGNEFAGDVIAAERRTEAELRSRLLRPRTLLSFGLAVLIIVFLFARLDVDLGEVWRYIRNADPLPLAGAALLYYGVLMVRAFRWRWMLASAGITPQNGYRWVPVPRMGEIILLSWFVNSVVPAKLGDAYRCYLMKEESGAPFSLSLGTLIAERLFDLGVLFTTMAIAGMIAFGGDLPPEVQRTLIGGIAVLVIGLVVVGGMVVLGGRAERWIPTKVRGAFATLRTALVACFRSPWVPLGISVCIWCADGLRLFLVVTAMGGELDFELALFVALMAALVTVLPVTPAGLGVVETAVIVVLTLVGMNEDIATSIAFVDRVITFWSLIGIGLILYLRRVRREVKPVLASPAMPQ